MIWPSGKTLPWSKKSWSRICHLLSTNYSKHRSLRNSCLNRQNRHSNSNSRLASTPSSKTVTSVSNFRRISMRVWTKKQSLQMLPCPRVKLLNLARMTMLNMSQWLAIECVTWIRKEISKLKQWRRTGTCAKHPIIRSEISIQCKSMLAWSTSVPQIDPS